MGSLVPLGDDVTIVEGLAFTKEAGPQGVAGKGTADRLGSGGTSLWPMMASSSASVNPARFRPIE
jgi:hypothetical protein